MSGGLGEPSLRAIQRPTPTPPFPRRTMTLTRTRISRLIAAAVLVVTAIAVPLSAVHAAPTEEEVKAAEARLDTLAHELERAGEQLNDARYRLQQVKADLDES